MDEYTLYDTIIIGGGLAGLSLAIQLAGKSYKVLVLEKDEYPRHRVCGEYISEESKPFLERIGFPVSTMQLPQINDLLLTDARGTALKARLPQGGFGISRYKLDYELSELASVAGATVVTKTKVEDVHFIDDLFKVEAGGKTYCAKVACGAWGKRSSIDVKEKRNFIREAQPALSNYIGIKYHIRYPWPEHLIALHNFKGGYCGISRIEDNLCCLCYLTNAANLKSSGNDIKRMEQQILYKNEQLKVIFNKADFIYKQPLAISQISFEKKEQVLNHVLLLGDAAGLITPLCGNGMSMAFHASMLAYREIDRYLRGGADRQSMEKRYGKAWVSTFGSRLRMGRFLQSRFGNECQTTWFLRALKTFSFLQSPLIRATAGKPF